MELLPSRRLGHLGHLREAILDDVDELLAELLEVGVFHRIDDAEPLGQEAVMQLAAGPEREVVAVLRIVERRPEERVVEVMGEALRRNACQVIAQLAEILGASPEGEDRQRAVDDSERRGNGEPLRRRLRPVRIRIELRLRRRPPRRSRRPSGGAMVAKFFR
jgi:hypothetical protein